MSNYHSLVVVCEGHYYVISQPNARRERKREGDTVKCQTCGKQVELLRWTLEAAKRVEGLESHT